MAAGGFGRRWAGVLAAYLLVLQAALSGLALGAAPLRADPLSVICHGQGTDPAPGPAKRHGGMPGCCVAGCPMLAGGMAPPPEAGRAPDAPVLREVRAAPPAAALAPPQAERNSRGARAPPARSGPRARSA